MISCGKKARKRGGNRHAIMRSKRRARHAKVFANNQMTPAQYQAMKLSARKRLAK